jgi:hypothetical protein
MCFAGARICEQIDWAVPLLVTPAMHPTRQSQVAWLDVLHQTHSADLPCQGGQRAESHPCSGTLIVAPATKFTRCGILQCRSGAVQTLCCRLVQMRHSHLAYVARCAPLFVACLSVQPLNLAPKSRSWANGQSQQVISDRFGDALRKLCKSLSQ